MALPQGFVLEDQPQESQGISLPAGFQLESEGAAVSKPQQKKEDTGFLQAAGRGLASLADTTIGGIIPAAVQQLGYPLARLGKTPEEASKSISGIVSALDNPFGKAFGVTGTPEYQGEASRKLMEFVSENVGKGAKWIADKTGMAQADAENIIGSLSLTAPAVAKGTAKVAAPAVKAAADTVKAGTELALEKPLQARRQAASKADYARGPQIDAAAEAQRLGLAISPENIQPTMGTKLLSAVAGESGLTKIAEANKNTVRTIALNELGLPADTQLNGKAAFNKARAAVSGPYKEVRQLPTMTADESIISSLKALTPDQELIATDVSAKNVNKMVDRAVEKVSKGLTGDELLRDVQQLRENARKIYNNKNADLASLDRADASIGIANILENMIESNISNPKLLGQFREARKQMAKTYAYEGATDFNTGIIDATKLSKLTAKDSALTGDIAALGRVAGNFPEAFTAKVSTGLDKSLGHLKRSGPAGVIGGLTGYALGGGFGGAVGAALGASVGELSQMRAASKIASPAYQAGLSLLDRRIPVQQAPAPAAAPIPQNQAIVPYQAPVEVLNKGEGPYQPNFTMVPNQYGPRVSPSMPPQQGLLSAPSAQGTLNALRAEDVRRAGVSRALGQQAEAAQAAAEAASRKPASREVILDIDPITGRLREASQGIRGATPEIFSNFGSSLETAASKVTLGKNFDMTAAEKVAWEKTKVDLSEVAPGLKALSDKAIAEKMLDREWVAKTAQKAREKAQAFEEIAKKSSSMKALQEAMMNREKMMDIAAQMEESLRMPRPDTSRKQQGPKTRAAFRERLVSFDELMNR